MKALFILIGVLAIVAGGAVYYIACLNAAPPTNFRVAEVKRDTIVSSIEATGTAEPEELIDVGAQVTGRIQSLGPDPINPLKRVDYCSRVEERTLLANIDPTVYKAQVAQAAAQLAHDKASLLDLKAKSVQALKEFQRAKELLPKNAIAQTDYDLDEANYNVTTADVEVGKAQIQIAEAALVLAKTNLDYCTIRAPCKGVIISRRVSVGQTVVSAMSASSLFLFAKDLRRMQIWAQVNEADIGRIHAGLPVTFTIDTYRGEVFKGMVEQVRLNAQSTQNVVTYTVVVISDNPPTPEYPNGKVLPYITATVKFEVEQHPNVLLVPNAALRWKPRTAQIAPDARKTAVSRGADDNDAQADAAGGQSPTAQPAQGAAARAAASHQGGAGRGPGKGAGKKDASVPTATGKDHAPAQPSAGPQPAKQHHQHGRLWVRDGEFVRPIRVRVGLSDGSVTEVSGTNVKEGMQVVIGEESGATAGGSETNPFLPQIFRSRPKSGGSSGSSGGSSSPSNKQ